jgi:hypothetical protein
LYSAFSVDEAAAVSPPSLASPELSELEQPASTMAPAARAAIITLLDFINVPFFRDGEPSVSLSPLVLERSNTSESCCDRHHLAGEFRGQLPHCYQRGAQLAAERAPTP